MDNKPAIERDLLIPLLIGGFSVVGIVVVLLIGRAKNTPAEIPMTPSLTPFQYIYLGTEPAISTPFGEGSGLPPTDEFVDELPGDATSIFTTATRPSASTPLILPTLDVSATSTSSGAVVRTNTPNPLPTSTPSTPVVANTYDDTDARLSYSTGWVSQTGVNGTYQNTLHVSDTIGNSVTFTFTGQEIQLFYQAGSSLGTLTITFDADTLAIPVNQAQSNGVWVYMLETSGSHTVTIRHTSGGSVNIDKLVIPAPTATPTRTPTPTP
jgi:hypothetical protein